MMRLIAITHPYFIANEHQRICRLLDDGWFRVHIRKPEACSEATEALISRIPSRYYPFISLHDHYKLAEKYGIGGIHLNSRNPVAPEGWSGLISRSCHSIEELSCYQDLDYLTLSPVFDSISKHGYKSRFDHETLKETDLNKVYALGGVTFSRLRELEILGFEGAAMLSEAWKQRMETLQYITDTHEDLEPVLKGGCRWVQLRMKDASDDEFIKTAEKIKSICRKYGATLILDDRVHLVGRTGADGVHLGKNDMPVREARKMLGPSMIIGATANTEDDIRDASEAGADYIGLGPFRFTTTKKGLAPILGTDGYRKIMSFRTRNGITVPVVAIGGIRLEDIPDLIEAGVDGIAVSGLIMNSTNKEHTTKEILRIWKN